MDEVECRSGVCFPPVYDIPPVLSVRRHEDPLVTSSIAPLALYGDLRLRALVLYVYILVTS